MKNGILNLTCLPRRRVILFGYKYALMWINDCSYNYVPFGATAQNIFKERLEILEDFYHTLGLH